MVNHSMHNEEKMEQNSDALCLYKYGSILPQSGGHFDIWEVALQLEFVLFGCCLLEYVVFSPHRPLGSTKRGTERGQINKRSNRM